MAVSIDSAGLGAALTEKLRLPFPVLSDPDGESAIKPFDAWNDVEERAAPVTLLLASDGSERWRHAGTEPSDRPFTDDLLVALRSLGAPARPAATGVHPRLAPEQSEREVGVPQARSFFQGVASGAGGIHRHTGDAYAGRVAARATEYADALHDLPDLDT